MEAEGRYTFVGTIVLVALGLLAVALVWLAGGADHSSYQKYTIYFRNQSMEGLAVGSPVKMRGIKVGEVDSYRFVIGAQEAVSVRVKIDEGVPVRSSSSAYVKRNLVTSIAAIEITNKDNVSPMLTRVSKGERYPVISEGSSDLDKVAIALTKLALTGAQVLERMNALMSDENQLALSQTLKNLNELTGDLAANKQGIQSALQGITDASTQVEKAGESVTLMATNSEKTIKSVGEDATKTLKEATVLMDKLQKESVILSTKLQDFSETSTLELTNISRDVRGSADALATAGQRLSDPRAALFGAAKKSLGPGEK